MVLGNKKAGIFNKIADTTRDLQGAATGGAFASTEGTGRFSLERFMESFEDLADKQWGTPKATLDTDLIGLMRDVFVTEESHTRLLQGAWAEPEIFRALVDELPFFDVIKPLQAYKKKDILTAKDVSLCDAKQTTIGGSNTCTNKDDDGKAAGDGWLHTPSYNLLTLILYVHHREWTPCWFSKTPWANF